MTSIQSNTKYDYNSITIQMGFRKKSKTYINLYLILIVFSFSYYTYKHVTGTVLYANLVHLRVGVEFASVKTGPLNFIIAPD